MKVKRVVNKPTSENYLWFKCPGCGDNHILYTDKSSRLHWDWNGDFDKPTLSPSVLVTSGHYVQEFKKGSSCWCTFNKEHPDWQGKKFTCYRCHSWVKSGRIEFLRDSTHPLAGQTVDLPEIEE